MKRAFWYGLAGLGALTMLAAAVPLLVPASVYKDRIENGVTRATGRKFSIAGPLHLSLFPTPAIRADGIALAGIQGGNASSVATADDIQLGIRLWPLFSGRVELTRIVLDRPAISLEVTEDGRANWIFQHARKTKSVEPGSRFSIAPHFSNVEIVHGTVTYASLRTGTKYTLEDFNTIIGLTEMDRPITATGSFTWSRRPVSFRAKAAKPEQLLGGSGGKIELSLTSSVSQLGFSGDVAPEGGISGKIKIDTASLRDTATWLGAHMPDSNGFGSLSLQSTIESADGTIALKNLTATLGGMHINGDLRLATEAPLPFAEGALSVDGLDLNPYIAHRHGSGTRHHSKAEAWSYEPVSLEILRKVNALLVLDTRSVTIRSLKLGRTRLRVGLRDGRLDATLFPMSLYGGTGKATLSIDANRPSPAFHNDLEFTNVALQPFLSDTIGVKQIEGIGTIKLDVASAGANPLAIMHGLNGKGSIAFRDGRLRGVDLGAVARAIHTFLGNTITPDSITSFSSMSGSFTLANGVLTNRDFQLNGGALKTAGAGTVDVGNRSIDFRIVPQATAIIAKEKLSLGVPFRIKGPWTHVHYTADIAGFLNGVLENLETGKAPFKGLLGPSKPKDPNAAKKKHKSVGDALKNMLGIH